MKKKALPFLPCFYCGVDERQLKLILISVVGSFVFGSLCVLIWAWLHGGFRNVERIKFDLFEAERRGE